MGIRFRKSIKIANGVKLNVSKSGVSLSLGKKGLHYTINSKGRSTATASLVGTGLSYSKSFNTGGFLKSLIAKGDDTKVSKKEEKDNKEDRQKLEEFNAYMDELLSFHKYVSDPVDWEDLSQGKLPSDLKGEEKETYQKLSELAKRILEKEEDAYLEVLEQFSTLEEIAAFGSDFEFGFDDSSTLFGSFNVKMEDVIPSIGFKEDEKGKISDYTIKETQRNDYAQDYVCSCSIRIAREVFALLPVDMFVLNAQDELFDSATGNKKDATILSVLFVRNGFEDINFDAIDPSDFIGRFKNNASFTKSKGFKEVSEIVIPKL